MSLTSDQVLKMAPGLTYRRLDYWTRRGFVSAVEADKAGIGYPRRYDFLEAQVVATAHRLNAVGFAVPIAAVLARYIIEGEMRRIPLGPGLTLWVGSEPDEEVTTSG